MPHDSAVLAVDDLSELIADLEAEYTQVLTLPDAPLTAGTNPAAGSRLGCCQTL